MLPPPFGPELEARVRGHLAAHERLAVPLDGRRHAAVAVTLVADDADDDAPCFLLTKRTPRLTSHAGQWALPGGRVEPGESAIEGALRELAEELGMNAAPSQVLGCLDDYPTRSGYVITPVVVWAGAARELTPNPAEVASIHRIPASEMLRDDAPLLNHVKGAEHPVLRMPVGERWIAAPTAAFIYQFREWCLLERATRVAHFDQPVFAWK